MNALQDDKGNYSSLRIMLIFVCGLVVWMYVDWRKLAFIESARDNPDYSGLTNLFLAMLVTFGLAFASKLIQKKFEK